MLLNVEKSGEYDKECSKRVVGEYRPRCSSTSCKNVTFCNIYATIRDINLKLGIYYVHYQRVSLCDKGR